MKKNKLFFLIFVTLVFFLNVSGQESSTVSYYHQLFDAHTSQKLYNEAISLSKSGNAYDLMSLRSYLGANNAIVAVDPDRDVIRYQVQLINNIVNSAETSKYIRNNQSPFNDNYKTWISRTKKRALYQEVPLYESYAFYYIAQFLYYTKQNGWSDSTRQNQLWWTKTLAFLEKNIWTKWYKRSYGTYKNNYTYFLRSRTHMGSHWAGVAMYLNFLTNSKMIRKQTAFLTKQYDKLLKRNLKVRGRGYSWNATYDNVEGTYAAKTANPIIQDVAHGNHVVAYIVAACEFGNPNWSTKDIERLSYTLTDFIYDKKKQVFRDNVDGSFSINRTGWGNFVADGWVKLLDYNTEVKKLLEEYEKQVMLLNQYNQALQYKSYLNRKRLYGKQK